MWLVNAALKNPYSVYVGMLLTAVLGIISYSRTPTDILPHIKAPVVVVFASYRGMPAPDMEQSVTAVLERALTKCDYLEHIESRSMLGIGIIHVHFRPTVDPDVAYSQVESVVNSEMQSMPPGMLPPTIFKYDASAVPVGNLIISSRSRDDRELLDIADHQLRDSLAGIPGLASAPVFGGVFRQVQIYVHPRALESLKLSPMDVARIVNTQSQVIPTGEIRIGNQNYYVSSNSMVGKPGEFEKIPLYSDGRKIVYLGDVANVLDASRWRTNTVHANGRRAVYMPLLRQAGASAVAVVDEVKAFLPKLHKKGTVPADVDVEVAFDQSQYVRDAMANLRLEGILGAVLASLVVLLFLGNLRSTLVVALSIPLSVLAAFLGLYFTGHTLNIMTLGGLALILGRVVDDSIVDVENTVRHLNMGKDPVSAARDSAAEISVPVFMATVTTVIVFFPLTFMTGVGKYLFTPLAVSASLAMGASYLVSRTVSPLYCSKFLRAHAEREKFPRWLLLLGCLAAFMGFAVPFALEKLEPHVPQEARDVLAWPFIHFPSWLQVLWIVMGAVGAVTVASALVFRMAPAFERGFELGARSYERALRFCLRRRLAVAAMVLAGVIVAAWCFGRIGQELFPEVDASEFTLHLRLKGGPRVEATEERVREIQKIIGEGELKKEKIRDNLTPEEREAIEKAGYTIRGKYKEITIPPIIPPEDLHLIMSNMGLSSRWSAIYTTNNGPHAAFIRVQLRSGFAGRTTPTLVYVDKLRKVLEKHYPGDDYFFETGGMIRQILNQGAVAPIEVQISARDMASRREVARVLDKRIERIPQVLDTYMPQGIDLPQLKIEVDRTAAARLQLTQTDVVRNVIVALMSSAQLAPNFWMDPKSGNPYFIGVQYPEHLVENLYTLENIPLSSTALRSQERAPLLRDVANVERTQAPVEVYHYKLKPVSQLFVSVADQNLAKVAAEVERIVNLLPLNYAIWKIPRVFYLDHALKVFPRDKGDPAADERLHQLLKGYFRDENEELADELEVAYGLTPADLKKLDLAHNERFRERLEYYAKKGRGKAQQEIIDEFGIDPEPLRLPPDVSYEVRGEVATMRDSFGEMGFNLAMAVVLVYLIMAAQFSSWLDPFIMVVAAPLGLVGLLITLWLTGTSINVQSGMGVLMMIGISVSNSVLVVEFANRELEAGLSVLEAVVSAARVRLRPILMTTVAAVAALLPMSIHVHPGDEMNLPLGRAIIGGLTGSTLLTLFVVPVLYVALKGRHNPATTNANGRN
jgi:multidrug efflux pump subunit AcrB